MSMNQTILDYKGPIEFKVIEVLLQKVKNDLRKHDIKKVLKKRVYNIIVECVENILKHEITQMPTNIHPYIILEKGNTHFLVTAGNLILNEEVEVLKERLNEVTRMDKEGLLKMYENQINKENTLMQDGAGLGIITIALKSNNKISYKFTRVNEQLSVFELQVTVPFQQF